MRISSGCRSTIHKANGQRSSPVSPLRTLPASVRPSFTARRRNPLEPGAEAPCPRDWTPRALACGSRTCRDRALRVQGPGAEAWLTATGFAVPLRPIARRLTQAACWSHAWVLRSSSSRPWTAERSASSRHGGSSNPPFGGGGYPVARADLVMASAALISTCCYVRSAASISHRGSSRAQLTSARHPHLHDRVGVVAFIRGGSDREPVLTLWLDPSFAHYSGRRCSRWDATSGQSPSTNEAGSRRASSSSHTRRHERG